MRAWMMTAFVLAGCLHSPKDTTTKTTAETLERSAAGGAWRKHFLAGQYALAAEAAWKAKLDPMLIGLALEEARKAAQAKLAAYPKGYSVLDEDLRQEAWRAFQVEVRIACLYGPVKASGTLAIDDVIEAHAQVNNEALRRLLLQFDCPVEPELRDDIIDAAASDKLDDFAFEQIEKAKWDAEKRSAFVAEYFATGYVSAFGQWGYVYPGCDRGLRAVSALRPPPENVVKMLIEADCEEGTFDPSEWLLPQEEARQYFFAAMQSEEYDIALALAASARMGDEAKAQLFQHMLRGHWEYRLKAFLDRHPEEHEHALAIALTLDEVRIVGRLAKTGEWVRRAFDRALELKLYEDATIIAEVGCDDAFRKEGPALAFKAALDAEDFVIAHRLARRNPDLIDKEEARKAADGYHDWRARQPLPPMKKLKRKKAPKCAVEWPVDGSECKR
ncbi:MAG: hypothetical protein QY323_03830 [Patescibacteria group bacterium]|nr:MAG: hypothetical protein QY323_03830 [Patescibacteria group bacterium]